MSSSVKSTLRSSSRPSRLRNFLGEPLFSRRERTKSRTSFCFSGGSSRSFSRTFSSMVMDRLLGVLASLYACRRTDGRVARRGQAGEVPGRRDENLWDSLVTSALTRGPKQHNFRHQCAPEQSPDEKQTSRSGD